MAKYRCTKGKSRKVQRYLGLWETILYRDRGFAISKPVTAQYYFSNPKTMCLPIEYNGSVFKEEFKLIGSKYRTRQTIISRACEQLIDWSTFRKESRLVDLVGVVH